MSHITWMDGHCDTAAVLFHRRQQLAGRAGPISLEAAHTLGGYAQFFAFCTEETGGDESALFAQMYENFQDQLERYADQISLCGTAQAAEAAAEGGQVAAFLSLEGAGALHCDPGRLEEAYQIGVRMVSLTWNGANRLAGSHITGEGLTPLGRAFVRRAQHLGMIVDVSHLSERAFWDLCEIAERPVIASHSNARACCAHSRNLTDEQFRALCQLGGTAGLNLYSPFLAEQRRATFSDIARHLDHFLELGGADHIALGGDLDGCNLLPEGFESVADLWKLNDFLQTAGFPKSWLDQMNSKNLMRVVIACGM